jgi:hypothetical protein
MKIKSFECKHTAVRSVVIQPTPKMLTGQSVTAAQLDTIFLHCDRFNYRYFYMFIRMESSLSVDRLAGNLFTHC